MSDDREHWRRQDELREERSRDFRRADDLRADRLHDYRIEDERRADWEREDRECEARQREENHRRAMKEMRESNTAWALNHMVGPDAAINYLNAMKRPDDEPVEPVSASPSLPTWPPNTFVTTVDELLENVATAPLGARLRAVRIDSDGDGVIEAVQLIDPDPGRFWVNAGLLDRIGTVAWNLARGAELASALQQLTAEG